MKLIVGLGNPGNQYNFTRHNFGFLALDLFHKLYYIPWREDDVFQATYEKINLSGNKFITIKPKTFYNESGKAVARYAKYYKIPPENILVICDDFSIPFGELRFREKGSAGGNNGLKSIIKELGTEDFPRLRLGTGNDDLRQNIGDTDFVLSRFTPHEQELLPKILSDAVGRIGDWSRG